MMASTTQLNTPGRALAELGAVHALTDVTGFGLLGHLLEMCRGAKLAAELRFADLPLIAEAVACVKQGVATGASARNWKSYGDSVCLQNIDDWQQKLLTDPQTSGGLLVACAPEAVGGVMDEFTQRGFGDARVIGRMVDGKAGVTVS